MEICGRDAGIVDQIPRIGMTHEDKYEDEEKDENGTFEGEEQRNKPNKES